MNYDLVESLEKAQEWFLNHSSGSLIAHDPEAGDFIRVCETYKQATEYFAMAASRKSQQKVSKPTPETGAKM